MRFRDVRLTVDAENSLDYQHVGGMERSRNCAVLSVYLCNQFLPPPPPPSKRVREKMREK